MRRAPGASVDPVARIETSLVLPIAAEGLNARTKGIEDLARQCGGQDKVDKNGGGVAED